MQSERGYEGKKCLGVFRLFPDARTENPGLPFFGGYIPNISKLSFIINDLGSYNRWLQ